MSTILPPVPPAVSLMCTDCEGSWLADWLLEWEFTTCPNCGGELRPPTWVNRGTYRAGVDGAEQR